nr:MAG TPA: hypothetical protein [Caudoviricetes sp.]
MIVFNELHTCKALHIRPDYVSIKRLQMVHYCHLALMFQNSPT